MNGIERWLNAESAISALLIISAFLCLLMIRQIFSRRFGNHWMGKATSKIHPIFLLALSAYGIFHLSKRLDVWEKPAHTFMVIAASLQLAVFGSSAINQYILGQIRKRAVHDPAVATMQGMLRFLTQAAFYIFLVLFTLNNLGVNITALIAGLGISGFAVALAIQSILVDFIASMTIILDKPFVVGDWITIGDFTGQIIKIGLKNSRLMLRTGETLIVANSDLLQSRVRNLSTRSERTANLKITLRLGTPTDKLKLVPKLAQERVEKIPHARFVSCHLAQITEVAFIFDVEYALPMPISDETEWYSIRSQINYGVVEALRGNQIEIA